MIAAKGRGSHRRAHGRETGSARQGWRTFVIEVSMGSESGTGWGDGTGAGGRRVFIRGSGGASASER